MTQQWFDSTNTQGQNYQGYQQQPNAGGWGFGNQQMQQQQPMQQVQPITRPGMTGDPGIGNGFVDMGANQGLTGGQKWWGGTAADGTKTAGMLPVGGQLLTGAVNAGVGLGQLALSKEAFKDQQDSWQKNWDKSVGAYNLQLRERQDRRVESSGGTAMSSDDYVAKYGA
jgi:hypothetical protein